VANAGRSRKFAHPLEIGVSDRLADRISRQYFDIPLLAALYFVVAKGGLSFASIHPSATPVWPPSGIALAALLLGGFRLWPAVFAGAFLANIVTFGSILTSLAIAGGNTLEALTTAWLLMRWSGGTRTFDTPARVAMFTLLCLVSGTLLSATIGVGSLTLAGYADPRNSALIWLTWWLGDVGGQLLLAPVIVLWALAGARAFEPSTFRSSVAVATGAALIGFVAFGPLFHESSLRTPASFLAIVPLLWAALRYTQRDTATAALVVCCFAIWGTLEHSGPLVGVNINDSFILVLTFVISAVVPSLILSSDVTVRLRVEQDAGRLALIVESSEDAIIATDLFGNITSWNRGAERLYGYSPEEAMGQSATVLISEDNGDEEETILRRIRRGEHIDHFETVRCRKDRTLVDVSLSVSPIKDASGKIVGASKIARDVTERKRAEQRQALLFGEMKHRIKNSLSILQSVAHQTLASASPEDRQAFIERLHAMARAQDLLTIETWNRASLRDVVAKALEPFHETQQHRFSISGPETQLGASQAMMLGMALFELATNAAKYGALSSDSGHVRITWSLDGRREVLRLNLSWQESGGPYVKPPSSQGFGSMLIERGLTGEGGGSNLEFLPEGLCWTLEIPIEH
jgi:PAS domain S-box-containing protein